MNKALTPWQEAVRPSPFHGAAASHSLTNEWLRWGEYTIADLYSTVEQEYDALRTHAGLIDLSPLHKVRISGKEACSYLNRLLTYKADDLPIRQACFSPFCDDAGHVIGLARLLRVHVDEYHLYTDENHDAWLWDTAQGYDDVQIDTFTHDVGVLGLFGNRSQDVLMALGIEEVEDLEISHHDEFIFQRVRIRILKTVSMGELGYYLNVDPKNSLLVWETLIREGEAYGLAPVGRRVQDICRIEAGELRAGADFIGAHQARYGNRPRTPFELGLAAWVELEKGYFVGSRALSHGDQHPSRTAVVGLHIEGTEPLTGGRILSKGQLVGIVTSCAWSPRMGHVVALATVASKYVEPGQELQIEYSTLTELEPEVWSREARIVEKPFYTNGL